MISKTKLGWALHGPINFESINQSRNFTCCQVDDNLHKMVKQQFSLENFGVSLTEVDKTKSIKDERALFILKQHTNVEWKIPIKFTLEEG